MNFDWESNRKIRTTREADLSARKLSEKYGRFEKQWKGLKLFLEKSPERGKAKKLESGRIVYVITRGSGYENTDLPEIMAVYEYNDKEVTIFDVAVDDSI